jgi:hypothetical protein
VAEKRDSTEPLDGKNEAKNRDAGSSERSAGGWVLEVTIRRADVILCAKGNHQRA